MADLPAPGMAGQAFAGSGETAHATQVATAQLKE